MANTAKSVELQVALPDNLIVQRLVGKGLGDQLTETLASRSRADLWWGLDDVLDGAPPEDFEAVVKFLDDYATYHGFDGPSNLSASLPVEIPRCPYCLTSPASEKITQLVHPDARPMMVDLIRRLVDKQHRNGQIDPSGWIKSHCAENHFYCCRQGFSSMDAYCDHIVQSHRLSLSVPIPSHLTTTWMLSFHRMLLSKAAVAAEPCCFTDELRGYIQTLELGEARLDAQCVVCGREGAHNTRVCTKDIRQRVMGLLRSSAPHPYLWTVKTTHSCLKSDRWIAGHASRVRLERRAHAENNLLLTTIVNVARMLVAEIALEFAEQAENQWHDDEEDISRKHVPLGDWRFWDLAFRVVAGHMTKASPVLFGTLEDAAEDDALAALNEEQQVPWDFWRDCLVDVFDNRFRGSVEHLPLYRATLGPLRRHAHTTATNLGTKMRGQVVKYIWRLCRAHLQRLKQTSKFLHKKGVLARVLVLLKRHILAHLPAHKLDLAKIDKVTSVELEQLDKDLWTGWDADNDSNDDADSPPDAPLMSQLRQLVDTVYAACRNIPICRLVETKDKERARRLPRPPTALEKWQDAKLRELLVSHTKKDAAELVERMCTKEKFAELTQEQQEGWNAGFRDDWTLFIAAETFLSQESRIPVPRYSYVTLDYERSCMRDGKYLFLCPLWETGEDGKTVVSWVQEPFQLNGNAGITERHLAAIVEHVMAGKKGMPGVTTSMLWKVYYDIQLASQLFNDMHATAIDGPTKAAIRLSEPVVSFSFSPMHFTFDLADYKDFVKEFLRIKIAKSAGWEVLLDLGPQAFVDLSELKHGMDQRRRPCQRWKRSSVRGPLQTGVTSARTLLSVETDGFDVIFRSLHHQLVPRLSHTPQATQYDLLDDQSRDALKQVREQDVFEGFVDPGRRQVVKMMFPLTAEWETQILGDPRRWTTRDDGILGKTMDERVYRHIFNRHKGTFRTKVYNAHDIAKFAPDAPALNAGSTFLIRSLPLSEYYRLAGFDKSRRSRKAMIAEMDRDPYEELLTQRSIHLEHARDCHDGWLARLDEILALEHKSQGGFGFRAAKLRTWHRKTKVLEQIAEDLVWHPIANKVVPEKTVLWYGAANFSQTSSGLRAGPGLLLKRLLALKCQFVPVDEFHSSKICCMCRCTELTGKSYFNRKSKAVSTLPHGAKRCWKCRITFDRDINGCLNIGYIGWYQLANHGNRPPHFFRASKT